MLPHHPQKDGKDAKDAAAAGKDAKKGKQAKPDENELSEDDQALKDNLDLMVERSRDVEPGIQANAIQARHLERFRPAKEHCQHVV